MEGIHFKTNRRVAKTHSISSNRALTQIYIYMYFFLIFKFLTILSLHFSVFVKLPPPPHFGHQILLRTLTDAITKWMYTWKKKPGTTCLHSIFITQLTSAIVNTDFDLVQHKVVSTVPQIGLYIVFFFLITSSQMKARWHQCLANIIR